MTPTQWDWLNRIINGPAVDALCRHAQSPQGVVARNAHGSATAVLAAALGTRLRRPVLTVVAHVDEADAALDDLESLAAAGCPIKPDRFCALETLPGESRVNLQLVAQRLALVEELLRNNPNASSENNGNATPQTAPPGTVVTPIHALMQAVPTSAAIAKWSVTLQKGGSTTPTQLARWLDQAGYQRVDMIEHPGDFAIRGGIVDIYPTTQIAADASLAGLRLDFFGDAIDSLRLIDLETMTAGPAADRVQLVAAKHDPLANDDETTSFLSLWPKNSLIILHDSLEMAEQARGYYERLSDPRGIYSPQAVLKALTDRPHVRVELHDPGLGQPVVDLPMHPLPAFDHGASKAVVELTALTENDAPDTADDEKSSPAPAAASEVIVLCHLPAERDRLGELLAEHAPGLATRVQLLLGHLHRGFVWDVTPSHCVYVVPHHELFHRYLLPRRTRGLPTAAGLMADPAQRAKEAFFDLEVGDYVVHADHGIAQFAGLKTMKRKDGSGSEEFLTLEFANNALLHVPATQVELVQKYIGGFQGRPPLSLLGGRRWANQKKQVAEAVKDLAVELLQVQAARASMPGIRFPADTAWQKEFEAEFPYEETPDQLAAIQEVKKDMAAARPMDRLICGDVGFGKTEVAVRAAFKAIEFGKQVAVLVPTTVLAEQHGKTFRQRMADYPFHVESISRFKTPAQAQQILTELAHGRIDVIIGTHRLLSQDVKFSDLGLVIVDEEQRFGVEHKQRLMQLRLTVDVLTLSATPIPRTLHMAMLGLRDISSLTIAPADRRPIVTEVVPNDPQRIQRAIHRELNRDGQVYFVHNRVHSINAVADHVKALVPDARVIIGHGQMPPAQLEDVMLRFMDRKADVLVCTTIIESGIDIPTANTMFIDQADHFGLADLHQLRGRVGRYKHRAYCYLLLPDNRPITDTATRRLKAIEQYAMLGAGFKIAMRDLEIRGAGNLLGAQQSGHIAAVGYDMYCRLLDQAAKRLRHEPIIQPARTHLELPVTAYLPKRYISSEKFRMDAYRRLAAAETAQDFTAVVQALTDTYGRPPAPAQALLDLTELRIAASTIAIDAIKLDGPDVIFRTSQPQKLDPLLRNVNGRVTLIDERTVYYRPPTSYLEPASLLRVLKKILVVKAEASAV